MSEASSGAEQDSTKVDKEEKEERDVPGELKPKENSGAIFPSCCTAAFLCVQIPDTKVAAQACSAASPSHPFCAILPDLLEPRKT